VLVFGAYFQFTYPFFFGFNAVEGRELREDARNIGLRREYTRTTTSAMHSAMPVPGSWNYLILKCKSG